MSCIRILPDILSNKIAAGEVVERPASVVKELLENSIDAKSSKIIIEIEKGGRSLIRISDNGIGMNKDDALLCIERYATSKILKEDDLFAINTLGFRGEALPSIAAVSRFKMVTRDSDSDAGTSIFMEGGTIKSVSEVGAPVGTMISVQQLFFNVPVRRKFLKTINTEMGHIADMVVGTAMGHPLVQFIFYNNGKLVRNCARVNDPFKRIVDILGKDLEKKLYKFETSNSYCSVSGWISSPEINRSTSQKIYIYVNGRLVKDPGIYHALFQGYKGRLIKGQFPIAVLFINVPFQNIDVNVHPSKNQIRFLDQAQIYNSIKKSVEDLLFDIDRPKTVPLLQNPAKEPAKEIEPVYGIQDEIDFKENCVLEKPVDLFSLDRASAEEISPEKIENNNQKEFEDSCDEFVVYENREEIAEPEQILENTFFQSFKIIGQYHLTYIVCEEKDKGLILIDQHAAHERVVFERLKKLYLKASATSQPLLIPETFDLGYREASALEKFIPEFNKFGLEIEPFGGNTFAIKSIPVLLDNSNVKDTVIQLAENIVELGISPDIEAVIDKCLILIACHSAIRANQTLSYQEIQRLLKELDECENPSHCPHGRPTWLRWSLGAIEKGFKRVV